MLRDEFRLDNYDDHKSKSLGIKIIYYLRKGRSFFKATFMYKRDSDGEINNEGEYDEISEKDYSDN